MEELQCLIQSQVQTDLLVYGNPGSGKTYNVCRLLETHGVKYGFIDCVNIVDLKLLLNKIYHQITGQLRKFETVQDLTDALEDEEVKFSVILKNLQIITTTSNINFDLFKLFHNLSIPGVSFIYIVSSTAIPEGLITAGIPKVYFKPLTHKELIDVIVQKQIISPISVTVKNFIKLTIETYYPYTRDLKELELVTERGWNKFSAIPDLNENLSSLEIYQIFKNQLNDDLISNSFIDNSEKLNKATELAPFTALLVITSYLASYNDPKFDFTLFSKLKEIRSGKRTFARRVRNGNVRKIINNTRWFEFERMISILKSIYKDCDFYENQTLKIDLSTYIEFNNLVTLRLLVRNENKYKVNFDLNFLRSCCSQLGFNIENYLAE